MRENGVPAVLSIVYDVTAMPPSWRGILSSFPALPPPIVHRNVAHSFLNIVSIHLQNVNLLSCLKTCSDTTAEEEKQGICKHIRRQREPGLRESLVTVPTARVRP